MNKKMFEILENNVDTEEVVVSKRGGSNAKNIIKVLKECLKFDDRLTDIEIENINKILDLLENGELPQRIVKEGNKLIKTILSINDFIRFYKDFEKLIPKVYIEAESKANANKMKSQKYSKEIILSEYFV